MMIDLTKYQADIKRFYTPEVAADLLTYSREALVAEVGEVIGLRAKRRRGDAALQDDTAYRTAVVKEMGDVLFSEASIFTAHEMQFRLEKHPAMKDWKLEAIADCLRRVVAADEYNARARQFLGMNSWQLLVLLWDYVFDNDIITPADIREIADANIAKLADRQANGLIRGSGHDDERTGGEA